MSLVASSVNVVKAFVIHGLTISTGQDVTVSSVRHNTAITEGNANIKMDRKYACK